MPDSYDALAPFYDLIHAELKEDVDFVLALADQTEGDVLELGCGSGRLLLPLAAASKRVVGLDSSAAMLARARERLAVEPAELASHVRLEEADIRRFVLDERFGLVLAAYNTLLHLDAAGKEAALRSTARHLLPGGRLFIDLENPLLLADGDAGGAPELERTIVDRESEQVVVQMSSRRIDVDRQILQVSWIFDVSPLHGGPVTRTVVEEDYHYSYAHELELMLQRVGLKLEALYGDYRKGPYREGAERLLALASLDT